MKRFRPKWETDYSDGERRCSAEMPGGSFLCVDRLTDHRWLWQTRVGGVDPIGEAKTERAAKTAATRAYNRLVREGVIKVEVEA